MSFIAEEMVGMREGLKCGIGSTNVKNGVTASDNISVSWSYYLLKATIAYSNVKPLSGISVNG